MVSAFDNSYIMLYIIKQAIIRTIGVCDSIAMVFSPAGFNA